MESDWERSAKRMAVDEIEKRVNHAEELRRADERRRRRRRLCSVAMWLLVLAGIVWFAISHVDGIRKTGWAKACAAVVSRCVEPAASMVVGFIPGFESRSNVTNDFATACAENVRRFTVGELKAWRDAPASVRVKSAPVGTVYHFAVPGGESFDIYRFTKTGGVPLIEIMSPLQAPRKVAEADFRSARAGRSYLVECRSRVFACGDLKEMESFRGRLRKSLKEKGK